ncbi:unnamed protein product [Mytilus edulis]|uniref:Uncharacterized protein n=1 Tax=Mytilus edulis TaxID=6550 RepID=A0A8S3T801_MYTED|nr:unnamed protein product [Mytilus edulis]
MNEDRYDALLKLFMDERKARLQLQNYVIKQQQTIDTLISLPGRMEKVENLTNKIAYVENSTASFSEKCSQLERKYEILQHKLTQLGSKLKTSENHTVQLEEELSSLRQVKAINQLQNLANLQQKVQIVQNNVNSLTVTSQARGQDMISMYKDLTVNKQKIVMLENDHKQINVNMSVIERTLKDNMTFFESSVNALEKNNLVINRTLEEINEHNIYVGFTAFGKSSGIKQSGYILKFPDIKTSFGISSLSKFASSGKFTCEKVDSIWWQTSLPPLNVQLMTDDHYETLFILFLDERKNRMQLQQYMEANLDQLVKQCNSCHSMSLKPQVTKPTTETGELAAKYQQLTLDLNR